MDAHFSEWLSLCLRWLHLIFGIMWIGNSFYFMWLDANLEVSDQQTNDDVEGKLWMVHSGGFYQVEKRRIKPGQVPKMLHWFKWEATFTLITGLLLLGVIYYSSNGLYLLDASRSLITPTQAFLLSFASILVSWLLYDALWQSLIAQKSPKVTMLLSFLGLMTLAIILCRYFSGRAAFIHVGAAMGTIMVANVWVRILPAQQQMVTATQEGRIPDYRLGKKAKVRSTHNSYMTLPVLFLMISNHYSATYGNVNNWLILALLILVGGTSRHVMLTSIRGKISRPAAGLAALGLSILIFLTMPASPMIAQAESPTIPFSQIRAIIDQRCLSCHSAMPTDNSFGAAPGGIAFDHSESIHKMATRILARAVFSKTMPLANKTDMTQDERDQLRQWIEQGAMLE